MPLGELGHISILIAWVGALVAGISYYASLRSSTDESVHWERMARYAYGVHVLTVLGAAISLFLIIYNHHFEYHYAWKHSSRSLPVYYVISCFWEGQEGSFLVWIFWNSLLGLAVIQTARIREAGVMIVLTIVQGFLLTMILGIYVDDIKIGSSAFSLLKDLIDDPIYQIDPNYVPEDGTGLNPLLQNIWMVIHPPIIFLGFGLSLIPFAFAMAGLSQRDYTGWLPKASIWTGLSVAVLGLGIMMGAYWAYETLNFGGYWNWDPVENAILIPWLVLLGALHGMTIFKKKGQGLYYTTILTITGFVLVVYSTFLTRSGILGDSSVHSFTDLGLSGQLLIFLLATIGISVFVLAKRYKVYQVQKDENVDPKTVKFWIVAGISVMCLSAFQVLIPTSIPVFSAISETLGFDLNMAPPADPVAFYNKFQLWFAVAFGLVMGTAQIVYWGKVEQGKSLENALFIPLTITLVLSSIVIALTMVHGWQFIILVISAIYGLSVCGYIIYQEFKRSDWSLGGSYAHLGFSLMILGFVFSGAYSKMISQNLTINAPDSSLPIHTIQQNALLNRNQTKVLGDCKVTYLASKVETADRKYRIDRDALFSTNYDDIKVLKRNYRPFLKGDTIKVNTENIYYAIEIDKNGDKTVLEPRMQNNPTMGVIASPDVNSYWNKDIYLHVTNFPDKQKVEWSQPEARQWQIGDTVEYMGVKIAYQGTEPIKDVLGVPTDDKNFALASTFSLIDGNHQYELNPIYLITQQGARIYPEQNTTLGIEMVVDRIDVATGTVTGLLRASQRDWITIKAKEMPFIGLVWMGTVIMVMGVMIAVVRRVKQAAVEEELVPMIVEHENSRKTKISEMHPHIAASMRVNREMLN
ncbi:cytochrome c biogenesis protein CcsA [Reichenbachiella versicolor]|uniref:cytochrome c biogenesis protein CcsA n=1 Tax=Reichenbachiella versicolor TaxID=1821036 RepID=UPI000D6E3025|nr:cytochrome c biogenesis protein CcsA [Reichenbachiella versicolor]